MIGLAPISALLHEVDDVVSRVIPRPLRVPLRATAMRLVGRGERAMLDRLDRLCPARGRALDIGANQGIYTVPLVRRARTVDAFEPQQELAHDLHAFANVFAKNLTVHAVAISDRAGIATLRTPYFEGRLGKTQVTGHASLDLAFERADTIDVPVASIDGFRYADVSFMKIDVEGHEERVIVGASETIRRCRPTILIEIEQRHLGAQSIATIFSRFDELDYAGAFFRDGELTDLAAFDVVRDQTSLLDDLDRAVAAERYVNMFVFQPKGA